MERSSDMSLICFPLDVSLLKIDLRELGRNRPRIAKRVFILKKAGSFGSGYDKGRVRQVAKSDGWQPDVKVR
jgi:hypothetical protein